MSNTEPIHDAPNVPARTHQGSDRVEYSTTDALKTLQLHVPPMKINYSYSVQSLTGTEVT